LGILGYGFSEAAFYEGISRRPHLIALDAGSTDGGPQKLGKGSGIVSERATKRDLGIILSEAVKLGIPVIIGSAGGTGCDIGIAWTLDIVKAICSERHFSLKTAVIHSDIDKEIVRRALRERRIHPLGPVPELSAEAVDETIRIVAQMGAEPYIEALKQAPQLIIGGRTYDPAVFAAFALMNGFEPALAWHMGKILECGALCLTPGTAGDCAFGVLRRDHFEIQSLQRERYCTASSVAAHVLYEKSHPALHSGPGFRLDVSGARYEQLNDYAVRVSGTRAIPTDYQVKLEGVRMVGYRHVVVAGIRDPIAIQEIDTMIAHARQRVRTFFNDIAEQDYHLSFLRYGLDGVMGENEPLIKELPHEIGLVIEVVAKDKAVSKAICSFVRSTLMHYHYPGRKATAGNLAMPFPDLDAGEVYQFNVYHLMDVADPTALFPVHVVELGGV
jgi:hypothetical protein